MKIIKKLVCVFLTILLLNSIPLTALASDVGKRTNLVELKGIYPKTETFSYTEVVSGLDRVTIDLTVEYMYGTGLDLEKYYISNVYGKFKVGNADKYEVTYTPKGEILARDGQSFLFEVNIYNPQTQKGVLITIKGYIYRDYLEVSEDAEYYQAVR